MAKEKIVYVCSECGREFPKWSGKCLGCGAWNSLEETAPISVSAAKAPAACECIDDFGEEILSESETPESIYMNKEFFSELRSAVENALSGTERRVFDTVIRGASYRETAEKIGISEKSVDNAMQRARRKIRAYLK